MAKEENELEAVMPSEFYLTILGKKRQVKFGNLSLAKIEQKYGSIDIEALQKDMEKTPMATLPFLLSISLKDKEGLDCEDTDKLLEALDDSNLSAIEVMETVTKAMASSLNNLFGSKK